MLNRRATRARGRIRGLIRQPQKHGEGCALSLFCELPLCVLHALPLPILQWVILLECPTFTVIIRYLTPARRFASKSSATSGLPLSAWDSFRWAFQPFPRYNPAHGSILRKYRNGVLDAAIYVDPDAFRHATTCPSQLVGSNTDRSSQARVFEFLFSIGGRTRSVSTTRLCRETLTTKLASIWFYATTPSRMDSP